MAKIAGVDVLLKAENDSGDLIVLGGQTGATLNREAETIDTTDKTSGGYSSSKAGIITWSIDADGFVVIGDEGFDLIEEKFLNRERLFAEIRMGDNEDDAGTTYKGYGHLVDLPLEFASDDAVTYSLSLQGDGVLEREKGTYVEGGSSDGGTTEG